MKLIEHLRSVHDCQERFSRIIELASFGEGESFDDLPEDERLRRGEELAAHWEAIADECERSPAPRLLFGRWSPEQMRAAAAVWRAGRCPR